MLWEVAPFRHALIDDYLAPGALDELMALLDDEPVQRYEADLYAFDATAPEPETAAFTAFRDAFAAALVPALSSATATPLTRADMRAYAYRPGHYLLPHTDHQDDLARVVAYAYYLPTPEPPIGGELELFAGYESARLISPVPNRLVVFEVGTGSLHQVREVLSGLRLSLAGWFYR